MQAILLGFSVLVLVSLGPCAYKVNVLPTEPSLLPFILP